MALAGQVAEILGIAKTAMIRIRVGISDTLDKAKDGGHYGPNCKRSRTR